MKICLHTFENGERCQKVAVGRGYCITHYQQLRRKGYINTRGPEPRMVDVSATRTTAAVAAALELYGVELGKGPYRTHQQALEDWYKSYFLPRHRGWTPPT